MSSELFRQENIYIAQTIGKIVEGAGKGEYPPGLREVRFNGTYDPFIDEVYLGVILTSERLRRQYPLISSEFHAPVSTFIDNSCQQKGILLSSPYGLVRINIIDINKNVFTIDNDYIFTTEGLATKFERVEQLHDPSSIEYFHQLLQKQAAWERQGRPYVETIRRVPEVANPDDSRFVDLQYEDYQFVRGFLKQIQSGDLIYDHPEHK